MHILITGASGFVGRHLIAHLMEHAPELDIYGTTLPSLPFEPQSGVTLHEVDLKDDDHVRTLIQEYRPDHIYHLAAQAFVPRSFEDPWETLENNILAQLNVIRACMDVGIKPRMLIIGSAEIYGAVQPEDLPLAEDADLRPTSPYSVSKIAQDMLGLQYHLSHAFPIVRVRAFNHIGPGQNQRFVAPDFATQIARIEAGEIPPVMAVGDLSAQRDFTDVRDIVRAYRMLMEHGTPGVAYNVCSGTARSIQSLLDTLVAASNTSIAVEVDPDRLRPATIPVLMGDYTRIRNATGWQPRISFEQTLQDVLDDCRMRIRLP